MVRSFLSIFFNEINVIILYYIEFDNISLVDHNQSQEAPPRIDINKVASYIKSSLHMDFLDDYFEETADIPLPDMLILRCNKMSTSTAYNVVNSVDTKEFLDIIDNLIEDTEGTLLLLLDTRIVTKVRYLIVLNSLKFT